MRVVQVTISMAPDGSLFMELPSMNGARRQVPVSSGPEGMETIRRTLAAQLHNRADTIGTDGKPTISQVTHWEAHLERVDHKTGQVKNVGKLSPDTCIWCLAHTMGLATDELAHRRARAILREQRRIATRPYTMGDGTVSVRKLPTLDPKPKGSKRKAEPTTILTGFEDFDFTQA